MQNQMVVERHNLEVKAQAEGLVFGLAMLVKELSCKGSQPGSPWCYALNKMVEEKAKDFGSSVAALTIYDAMY